MDSLAFDISIPSSAPPQQHPDSHTSDTFHPNGRDKGFPGKASGLLWILAGMFPRSYPIHEIAQAIQQRDAGSKQRIDDEKILPVFQHPASGSLYAQQVHEAIVAKRNQHAVIKLNQESRQRPDDDPGHRAQKKSDEQPGLKSQLVPKIIPPSPPS